MVAADIEVVVSVTASGVMVVAAEGVVIALIRIGVSVMEGQSVIVMDIAVTVAEAVAIIMIEAADHKAEATAAVREITLATEFAMTTIGAAGQAAAADISAAVNGAMAAAATARVTKTSGRRT